MLQELKEKQALSFLEDLGYKVKAPKRPRNTVRIIRDEGRTHFRCTDRKIGDEEKFGPNAEVAIVQLDQLDWKPMFPVNTEPPEAERDMPPADESTEEDDFSTGVG
jgi:hypothetical protein